MTSTHNNERLVVDVAALFRSYSIPIAEPGARHYRFGWIHTPCPFCSGHKGNHLGFSPQANVFTCHRCGRHGKFKVIAELLRITPREAGEICKRFALSAFAVSTPVPVKKHAQEEDFTLPGSNRVPPLAIAYLEGRGFDAQETIAKWNLRYSGTSGRYKYRIIAPITYFGKVVSFTGRDVTNRQQDRYLSAFPEDEIRSAKKCVYGEQYADGDTVIVVEGPADAWRIGHGAVATLGTKWTPAQARIISRWKRSFILFDPEEKEAQERAETLCHEVSQRNGHVSRVLDVSDVGGRDPGEFTKDEVKEIRRCLK